MIFKKNEANAIKTGLLFDCGATEIITPISGPGLTDNEVNEPGDIAVTNIFSPESGEGLSSSEPVIIELTNFGESTVSNFEVSFSVNGIDPVFDEESPVISDLQDIESPNDPGECGAIIEWPEPESKDNCGPPSLESNYQPGGTFPVGETDVFYTATDVSGNQGEGGFTVTVLDTNPPNMNCPDDFEVNVNAQPFELTEAMPDGGSYSGTGVIDGVFNPADAGIGDHLITYSYENPESGCMYYCDFYITVTGG